MPVVFPTVPTQAQLNAIAKKLDAKYPGQGYGAQFLAYAAAHPNWSLQAIESGFSVSVLQGKVFPGLAAGIGSAAGTAGSGLVSAASGAASAASNIASPLGTIGDFFSRLTQASTWLRIGEVLLGIVLLAVGVARITKALPIATKIAKTAGAVAVL